MRILLLTNNWDVAEPLYEWLQHGNDVTTSGEKLEYYEATLLGMHMDGPMETPAKIPPRADLVVSYCYKYILPSKVIKFYHGKCVNLHNGYLPWGRGAQPLFWAVVNNEPCGVTIHWMDEGLDTGPIIAQQQLHLEEELTFRQMYDVQHKAMLKLFQQVWPTIMYKAGSYHDMKEFNAARHVLTEGWDTPIAAAREAWK